jgi:electron transfer flavoprotein alpha subunit
MSVCVVAQHDNKALDLSVMNAITAAAALDSDVSVLIAGTNCQSVVDEAARVSGVSRVLVADNAAYEHGTTENVSSLVVDLQGQKNFSHIITAANTFGRGFLPHAAAQLDVNPIGDVISISSADTFVRPIYAGNALATVKSADAVKLVSVRPTSFDAAVSGDASAEVEQVSASADAPNFTQFVENRLNVSDRPELGSAKVVVAGGRGMGSGENFKLLEDLADLMGGAVGASRAAVDAGMVPNDMQIGQTGKVVAPDLYVAVGISGAIQHLAGMKDSKTIVAINQDEEAPIFQVADYGLVNDLFTAVPELTSSIKG